jgi:hypothetical protein
MSDLKTVNLDLHIEEVNALLGVLGDLPTKTGAWGLLVKIKQQAEAQLPAANDEGAEAA